MYLFIRDRKLVYEDRAGFIQELCDVEDTNIYRDHGEGEVVMED